MKIKKGSVLCALLMGSISVFSVAAEAVRCKCDVYDGSKKTGTATVTTEASKDCASMNDTTYDISGIAGPSGTLKSCTATS
jgi:hypothetical protein